MGKVVKLLAVEGNRRKIQGKDLFGKIKFEGDQVAGRCLFVQTDDNRNILFDVGVGAFLDPERRERLGVEGEYNVLMEGLKQQNIQETDIDVVILSNLHFDHAGGLLPDFDDNPPRLAFPNAKYYVSKAQMEWAMQAEDAEESPYIPILQELLDQSGRLVLLEEERHKDFDFASFRYFTGVTPGLLVSEIKMNSGPLVFTSDLVPGLSWVPQSDEETKALFASLINKNATLFFFHDPDCACGLLRQGEDGNYFAEPTELNAS